jgi:hypothetical protein
MNFRWPSQEGAPPRSSSTVLSNETDDSLRFPDLIITPPKQAPAAKPRRSAPETRVGPRRKTGVGAPLLFLTAAGAITSAAAAMILSSPELIASISSFLERMLGQ